MLKAAILACAICAGAGGAALWLHPSERFAPQAAALSGTPSIMELQANVDPQSLPVQEVREPF